jgi:indole-3-glycerol phosphate synthase
VRVVADLLERMRRSSEARVRARRAAEPDGALLARALARPAPPRLDWSADGFDLVAEIKRRAPSAGTFAAGRGTTPQGVAQRAEVCAEAGAAMISVLTEPDEFGGSLEDLAATARRVKVPVLRKDFLVDPRQAIEARAAGAAGFLVIVRLLDDPAVDAMVDAARTCGLFVLLEAFDERELERCGEARERAARSDVPILVGCNARDLATLGVDLDRLVALASRFPAGALRIAESGLRDPADAARLASAGYRAALVGTALMEREDPAPLVRSLLSAGRAATRGSCVSE